jgi:hypothetical protein
LEVQAYGFEQTIYLLTKQLKIRLGHNGCFAMKEYFDLTLIGEFETICVRMTRFGLPTPLSMGFFLQLTFPSENRLKKWIFRKKYPIGVGVCAFA